MSADLKPCLAFTLGYEGGFTDNPHDPGGATIFGITLATFRTAMKNARLGVPQLKALTKAQAENIYELNYYLPARADHMPAGLDLMLGDMAVNAGVSESVKLLQRSVGAADDGVMGPETEGLALAADAGSLIKQLGEAQEDFYRGLSTFAIFGKGWLARVDARVAAAGQMVATS